MAQNKYDQEIEVIARELFDHYKNMLEFQELYTDAAAMVVDERWVKNEFVDMSKEDRKERITDDIYSAVLQLQRGA